MWGGNELEAWGRHDGILSGRPAGAPSVSRFSSQSPSVVDEIALPGDNAEAEGPAGQFKCPLSPMAPKIPERSS